MDNSEFTSVRATANESSLALSDIVDEAGTFLKRSNVLFFLILNPSIFISPFISLLAQGRRFCCATKPPALRNGATFVAQQTSATPSEVQPTHPSLQFYYTIFPFEFHKTHFARKPPLFSKNFQNHPQNDCATVGLCSIESANVVGYNSNNLRFGSIGLVPQFVGMQEGGAIDLQDIKCNDAASDNVSFMLLDNIGLGGDTYFWINWYGDNGDESCWVDGAFEKVEGMTIQPGQGLWVAGSSTEEIFQSAGQVSKADIAVQLRFGSTMTGNPTPVAIDLQDIVCSDNCSDSVSFMILDNIGLGGDTYFWINWYGDNGDESCWVDGAFEKVVGMTVEPGQGLWIAGDNEEQYVTFPGVEL